MNVRSFSVLLVEDDENDVFFLKRAFQEAGIQSAIQVVNDGQEAIDYLQGGGKYAERSQFPIPCFMILDLKMPRRTGMEVLHWLRQQPVLRCLPVLILTSSAQRYDVERAYRLGVNAFVVKPSSVEKRTELAQHIKGFWLELNQPPLMCAEGFEATEEFNSQKDSATDFC